MKRIESGDVPRPAVYAAALQGGVRPFLRLLYGGMHVVGEENFPQSGPCIVAPVHRSMADIPAVGLAVHKAAGRRLHYVGKQELWHIGVPRQLTLGITTGWEVPLVPRAFTACGGIAITKNQQLSPEAKQRIDQVLQSGGALTMFPEGTRRSGPEIKRHQLHAGVAALALEHGVPLVPVGISGTAKEDRKPVAVAIGEPLQVAPADPEALLSLKGLVNVTRPVLADLHERLQAAQQEAVALRTVARL